MFTTRLISGIILVLLAILFVGQGGVLLFAVSAVISLIGLFELYRVLGIHRRSIALVGYATALTYYGILWWEGQKYLTLMIIASLMMLMALYVFTFPQYRTEEITGAFFGVCYVPVMLSFLYQTRSMSDGAYRVWLIFLSSWGCDTCAYCFGMMFGKHKLAPELSPKKSIEGAIGGAAGAAFLGFAYGAIFREHLTELVNPQAACAIACAIAAMISQVGDLAASAIKRNHGIKDYGHLIPGHGGVLDRFDSMIFTAPAIYFALTFLK
ncbi:phosphatidate cytidylyltransferase [Lacrimispora sp. 210928-DFI.3.58]|mgnify:CR=1 FL=1|uniref:phosphatidate cytidylyltransferase n=1 Tax=Lacrimispora sp. 210928-DFI.3.58 TaxID=2883214 RepID=UPI0015B38E74|nr:phosphatidate cytidylyltransferase [Lacrimispora sp. 210928-DFI.3.58]MCB7317961.1 phosphatidate cytidylyltransferase [Lacrimispora sp. 210928-DFI.3.58]